MHAKPAVSCLMGQLIPMGALVNHSHSPVGRGESVWPDGKTRGREMETLSAGLSPPPSAAPFLEKNVGSRSSVRDIFSQAT